MTTLFTPLIFCLVLIVILIILKNFFGMYAGLRNRVETLEMEICSLKDFVFSLKAKEKFEREGHRASVEEVWLAYQKAKQQIQREKDG